MEDWKPCSQILYHILNHMGYCTWIVNARKQHYIEIEKRGGGLISGSKGEGLSHMLQSDTDHLLFVDDICGTFEKDGDVIVEAEDPTRYMFRVEKEWSPPGYCMLILQNRPAQTIRSSWIERSLSVIDKGVMCLNATNFLDNTAKDFMVEGATTKPRAGPSLPISMQGLLEDDNVPTLTCPCSAALNAWFKRPRHHDWPSESLKQNIITTPANVVAVGSKESVFGRMEWRYCFNRAELKLMDSLNSTQTKLYVVLKMILKDHLKPGNKEITSYIMKNIVFWMCENNQSSLFTPSTLLSWIHLGLQRLKHHIESGNLSYYMIPERNLLDGKFSDDSNKMSFLDKLSKLLQSGACLVHVCKTVQLGLELYNEGLLEDYGWKRNIIEMDLLPFGPLSDNVQIKFELLRLADIDNPLAAILLPDLGTLILQGYNDEQIVEVLYYRGGLFLDHEKAADFAQLSSLMGHVTCVEGQ